MEIKFYFSMLQRGWWIIVLSALVAVAISLGNSYMADFQYLSTARFIITPAASLQGTEVVSSLNTLDRRSIASTYAEVMNSDRILASALEAMQYSPDNFDAYTVQAVVLPDANVLELNAYGPNPKVATELANSIGYQTIIFARGLNMMYDLNFLDTAYEATEPVSPQPLRNAGITLILGLIAGAALVIVSEQVRIPLDAYRQRLRLDSATGVFNARYFRTVVEEEIAKDVNAELSIGIVELSGLRDLLETLPPSGIQYLLNKVTAILRKELRGNDMIGKWNEISFSMLLPATPSIAAKRTFDRIYEALSQEIILGAYDITVKLEPHIGGAVYNNAITAADLFVKAESSLEQTYLSTQNMVFLWELNTPFWVQRDSE